MILANWRERKKLAGPNYMIARGKIYSSKGVFKSANTK